LSTAAPLLSVRNLRVEFPTRRGTLVAVHDVSFDIAPGEVLGVVGESGAGKSITGAAIIGLIDPPGRIAAGQVTLSDRRLDKLRYDEMRRVRGREIGAIFQDPLTSLNPLYTIGRQLVETIRTHLDMGDADARARAIELLEEVGIPAAARRIDHYPHQFSGGMRQRVVIALALAARPKLVIADEPTTALDVSIQAQIIQLIKRLCRDHGTAVMLVTHDMGVIAETADRVAVMYAGRIVEIGPVADVIHRPQHPYTIGLMGSIPSIAQDREKLAQIDGTMPRLTAVPPGCAFHPRCPRAFVRCTRDRPELMPAAVSIAACWLHDPVASREAHQRIAHPPAASGADRDDAQFEPARPADADLAGQRGRDLFVPADDVAGGVGSAGSEGGGGTTG
jgi:peptide/nickel transport system ATP-binding protein